MGFLSGLLSVAAPVVGSLPIVNKLVGGDKALAGIAAGLQAAGNAFGAAENFKNQLELLKQLIEALQLLLKSLNDWNELMWNKLNDYNSPANLRQLYEEAGLNPAYFLGEGKSVAGTVSSNAVSAPSAPTPAGNFQGLSSLGDLASISLIESLIRKNNADAGLSESELKTNELIREWKVKYQKALAGKTEEEITLVQAMTNKIKADEAYVKALKVLSDTLKKLLDLIIEWLPLLNRAQLAEVGARIRMYDSETNKNNVLAALAPVLAMAYKKIADAADKLADAALQNANTNEKVGDSIIKLNESKVNENNANTEYIKSRTKGQDILNDVDESTAGSKKFKQNVENYGGTCLEMLDSFWNVGTKIASDVMTGGATAVLRNGGSFSNPASYRVGYTTGYLSGSVDHDNFWKGVKGYK